MRIEEKSYTLEERRSLDGIRFHFESNGKKRVRKAVEYAIVMQFDGRNVYNLGFGDYNSDADGFFDSICTNNGDVYTVLNSIL